MIEFIYKPKALALLFYPIPYLPLFISIEYIHRNPVSVHLKNKMT